MRRVPTSLAVTCAAMSVRTISGWRTLSADQREERLVRLALVVELEERDEEALLVQVADAQAVERAADRLEVWATVLVNATTWPLRKIGVMIAISSRWPAQSQGSLVA